MAKVTQVSIDTKFWFQRGVWEVVTTGEGDYWGVKHSVTNAFITLTTKEISECDLYEGIEGVLLPETNKTLPGWDSYLVHSGYVAMNKDEYDLENMSFYKTKDKAKHEWPSGQEIVRVKVIFYKD